MSNPLSPSALAPSVWRDFWRARRELIVFDLAFKLLQAWLFVPAVALMLALLLARAGHLAVSNWDIVDFLLSPLGLLYAALFGIAAVALLLLEHAGLMLLAAPPGAGERLSSKQRALAVLGKSWRVTRLGAVVAALLAVAFLPFVLVAGLTWGVFLSQHDIYYYVTVRPPAFWIAASIGGLLLLGALAVAAWLYVRWAFALPILLFENQSAFGALRASRDRVRGVGWRVGFTLLGWQVGALLVGVALEAGCRLVARAALADAGSRPVVRILLLLTAQAGLLAGWSFVTFVGHALLMRRLCLHRSEQLGLVPAERPTPETEAPASPRMRRLAYLAVGIILLSPLAVWISLLWNLGPRPLVQVTAHRGHAHAAPENTLSAVRKAIESGADYAEIDVQHTADGVVVVLHDSDLKRVAGLSRRLDEMSFDEVRKLDVGSWFDPAFAGERIPTLEEVIDLARGRIKLNIELKVSGPGRELGRDVARLVREQDFESECIVTSLRHEAIVEAKSRNPHLRTGLIVAKALGDVSRLEVDVLSVRADHLTDELLGAARRQGQEVHVWTVNEEPQMVRLMKRGVDNIITSDPDLLVRVRREWANLTEPERLVLGSRLLLGLEP